MSFDFVCSTHDTEWKRLRRTGIGASEMAAVLDESPWSSALRVYLEKRGELPDNDDEVDHLLWGHRIEPLLIDAYARKSGRCAAYAGVMIRSREHPWALATLDGITWEPGERRARPLECKNVSAFKAPEWANGPPSHYVYQAHQQMLVTGEDRCTVAALIGGNRDVWADVPRDESIIRKIVYRGALFWERVLQGSPPEAKGEDAAKLARELYPADDGARVELPADLIDTVERIRELKAAKSAAEKEVKALEGIVQLALGKASEGVFAGSPLVVTWRTQERAGYTVEPSAPRVMSIVVPKEMKAAEAAKKGRAA